MKKNNYTYLILLIFTILIARESVAQDSLKNSLSISAFSPVPIGDFRSNGYTNTNAGYAKTGIGAQMEYSRKFFKQLSILANMGYYKNKVDKDALALQIKAITEQQTSFANLFSSASSTYWENYSITAGFRYQWWLGNNKKMGVEPYFTAGTSYCTTPAISYSVRIDNLTFETRNSKASAWAFTHYEGLKINYLITQKTKINLNIAYMNSSANAANMEHIVVGNGTYTRSYYNYNINNSVIILGVGVSTIF